MNPVYYYLAENKGKKLSMKKLSKTLEMKKTAVIYYCFKDIRIRRVLGYEVGCGKNSLNVFTVDN